MQKSMHKSETASLNLPKIKKQNRYAPQNKSLYLSKIQAQMPQTNDYTSRGSQKIQAQQTQLKSLLRNLNKQAHNILQDYLLHPKLQKNYVFPLDHIKKIRQNQWHNKQKIIEQCNNQIIKLQERCDCLKYCGLEQMKMHIQQTKKHIEQIKVENKDTNRIVTVNGLNIVRGKQYLQIKEGQQQKVLLDLKKQNLQANNLSVRHQIKNYDVLIPQLDVRINYLMQQYLQIIRLQQQEKKQQDRQKIIQEKRRKLLFMKTNIEQYHSFQRQKYLLKLKQLQNLQKDKKIHDQKITELDQMILLRKKQELKESQIIKKKKEK